MRPVLDMPLSSPELVLEAAALAGLLFAAASLTRSWSVVPDRIAVHFGIDGRPDTWGSKRHLLVLPVIVVVFYVGLSVLTRYPHVFNYPWAITEENAGRIYHLARCTVATIKAELVWLIAVLQWKVIRIAAGRATELGLTFVLTALLLPGATVGLYIVLAAALV